MNHVDWNAGIDVDQNRVNLDRAGSDVALALRKHRLTAHLYGGGLAYVGRKIVSGS